MATTESRLRSFVDRDQKTSPVLDDQRPGNACTSNDRIILERDSGKNKLKDIVNDRDRKTAERTAVERLRAVTTSIEDQVREIIVALSSRASLTVRSLTDVRAALGGLAASRELRTLLAQSPQIYLTESKILEAQHTMHSIHHCDGSLPWAYFEEGLRTCLFVARALRELLPASNAHPCPRVWSDREFSERWPAVPQLAPPFVTPRLVRFSSIDVATKSTVATTTTPTAMSTSKATESVILFARHDDIDELSDEQLRDVPHTIRLLHGIDGVSSATHHAVNVTKLVVDNNERAERLLRIGRVSSHALDLKISRHDAQTSTVHPQTRSILVEIAGVDGAAPVGDVRAYIKMATDIRIDDILEIGCDTVAAGCVIVQCTVTSAEHCDKLLSLDGSRFKSKLLRVRVVPPPRLCLIVAPTDDVVHESLLSAFRVTFGSALVDARAVSNCSVLATLNDTQWQATQRRALTVHGAKCAIVECEPNMLFARAGVFDVDVDDLHRALGKVLSRADVGVHCVVDRRLFVVSCANEAEARQLLSLAHLSCSDLREQPPKQHANAAQAPPLSQSTPALPVSSSSSSALQPLPPPSRTDPKTGLGEMVIKFSGASAIYDAKQARSTLKKERAEWFESQSSGGDVFMAHLRDDLRSRDILKALTTKLRCTTVSSECMPTFAVRIQPPIPRTELVHFIKALLGRIRNRSLFLKPTPCCSTSVNVDELWLTDKSSQQALLRCSPHRFCARANNNVPMMYQLTPVDAAAPRSTSTSTAVRVTDDAGSGAS